MRKLPSLFAIVLLAAATSGARAVSTNYGNFVGATVQYIDVTETTVTDPLPLFGAPVVAGDFIDFAPVSYNSSAVGPGGSDVTAGTVDAMVAALAGYYITDLHFSDQGDFTLAGAGGLGTFASVTGGVEVTVTEVDGVAITPVVITDALTYSPSNGDWNMQDDASGLILGGFWTGSLDMDVTQALVDAGVAVNWGATKLSLAYDNELTATSESGTSTLIAKKDVSIGATTAVPEPTAAIMAGLGGLALLAFRRRR